jgi:hypothetical protein
MPVKVKKSAQKKSAKAVKALLSAKTVVKKGMKDHSNDPFMVNKAKEMKAALKKHGLPVRLVHA